ncbi:MAG: hypothetical protein D3918_01265 [Candidatus Electrothrix sp. AX2]|nr:hypothetical protein [Candidatus Electrothrix gigas]
MKILAVTMGRYLQVFLNLYNAMSAQQELPRPALFVADSKNYLKAEKVFPELAELVTLKEWELTGKGAVMVPDFERIARFQEACPQTLWNALLCDRRIFFGRLVKSKQDYKSHYSYTQLLAILDVFLCEIEAFLEAEQPDVVLSFSSTTIGDYLFEILAKEKEIPYLQLKATKINNRLSLNDTGTGIPAHLTQRLADPVPFSQEVRKEALAVLDGVRNRGLKYEGAILFSWQRMLDKLRNAPAILANKAVQAYQNANTTIIKDDKHLPPTFRSAWYVNIVHPLRTYYLGRKNAYLQESELKEQGSYLFYPLHFEPEVSLQVFGKPFQNQIETVRNLALSVPVTMKVVVKEHPRSLGFRKLSYYKKLLAIPNVRLVDPFLPAKNIIEHADVVAVVSGSIGLEAAILGKPVLVLGTVNYELLPDSMVRKIKGIHRLDREIKQLIQDHNYDEEAVLRYISAIIDDSVAVNMYTDLLGKSARYSRNEETKELTVSYQRLSSYLINKVRVSTC